MLLDAENVNQTNLLLNFFCHFFPLIHSVF